MVVPGFDGVWFAACRNKELISAFDVGHDAVCTKITLTREYIETAKYTIGFHLASSRDIVTLKGEAGRGTISNELAVDKSVGSFKDFWGNAPAAASLLACNTIIVEALEHFLEA
jgi:hypothetical protein